MQEFRFGIYEEIGCLAALRNYGLSNMLLTSMPILFPLASLTLYSRTYFMIYLTFITDPTQQRSFGSISSVSEALTTNLITLLITTYTRFNRQYSDTTCRGLRARGISITEWKRYLLLAWVWNSSRERHTRRQGHQGRMEGAGYMDGD